LASTASAFSSFSFCFQSSIVHAHISTEAPRQKGALSSELRGMPLRMYEIDNILSFEHAQPMWESFPYAALFNHFSSCSIVS
jgi:hypothetical protein